MLAFGVFAVIIGVAGLFESFGVGLFCLAIGVFSIWVALENSKDAEMRHRNDYGKAPKCYRCGSRKVYFMTYDDKRDSINFWGAASSKIGKRYHCDNCGNEW